jgi:hypothetical protein
MTHLPDFSLTNLEPRYVRRHPRIYSTHAATEPIPSGWVPRAHFYTLHPVPDRSGVCRGGSLCLPALLSNSDKLR